MNAAPHLSTNGLQPQDQAETVTILQAYGAPLAKFWASPDDIRSYGSAWQFKVHEQRVACLDDLVGVLQQLEKQPDRCVIRGRPVTSDEAAKVLPELLAERAKTDKPMQLKPGHWPRSGRLFTDTPRRALMLDVDAFRPAEADPVLQPDRACDEFIRMLPTCFHERSYYFSLSGSAGAPSNAGVLKAHLWFWLEEPLTSAELKAWAQSLPGTPLDPGVFQHVQCLYTAAPIFGEGIHDPVPVRSGFVRGAQGGVVSLSLAEGMRVEAQRRSARRAPMSDPGEKPGLVGAFCRVFRPSDLLTLMGDAFVRGRDDRRFTWIEGHHRPDGVFITDCGYGLVSKYGTAPSGTDARVNVFDFVRLHRFGHLDLDTDGSTRMSDRPSFKAMRAWIETDCPEVLEELAADRTTAEEDFAGVPPTLDEVINQLRAWPADELFKRWADLAAQLPASEAATVVEEVKHLTRASSSRPLNAALKEAQARARDREAGRSLEAHAGGRVTLEFRPEDQHAIALEVEREVVRRAAPGTYVAYAGQLAHVVLRPLPFSHLVDDADAIAPPVPQIAPLNEVEVRARVESAVVLHVPGRGGPKPIGVPKGVVETLLEKSEHTAPSIAGLITHPLVLPDGSILATDGLHARSRLFAVGAAIDGLRPFTRQEAEVAVERLRQDFLSGFEFADPLDETVALAALLTAVQRRVLELAPGLKIDAATPSSGKTTLARKIHSIVSGHDMPVSIFPERNDDEAGKRLLAMLLRSPAMVCFDNITEGTTFRSPALAAVMTSPEFVQRVLGVSREVHALTNVFIVLTGNNVALGIDHATRFMTVRLKSSNPHPERRRFRHPDVLAHALRNREAVLRDVVGIVAGYLASGVSMVSATRFPRWDRMVRQALIWAGQSDVAKVFEANANGGEAAARLGLLQMLHEAYGGDEFSARDVAHLAATGRRKRGFADLADDHDDDADRARADAVHAHLSSLRAKDPTDAVSTGRVLAALRGSVQELPDGRLLELQGSTVNHAARYVVAIVVNAGAAGVKAPDSALPAP